MAWSKKALIALWALSMAGCDPQFNISGAYFPAWLACVFAGLIGTWLLHLAFVRKGIASHIRPAGFIYLCIFIAIACALWLLFFSV
ncbi:MAG: YtcA family lipoprotein [Chthoniobacterales bacterium]